MSTKDLAILHAFPVWLPQTQTWMYNQVSELQSLGQKVHVVCEQTENLDQFRVDNINAFSSEPTWRQYWDRGIRRTGLRRHLHYLVQVGRDVGANIVHSHFGNIGWANQGVAKQLGAKHVVTFYGLDVNALPLQNPVWRKRYSNLFAGVDLILCEGSHMAKSVAALGCPEHKIKVQHLGVDVNSIRYQPRQWRPGELLRVLIAASFREKKGIPDAIEALQIVAQKVPIQLTIIGDAGQDPGSQQEKKRILSTLERSGLQEHTRLLGYQTHQAMLQEAYQHHLFLQPSITAKDADTEGGAPVSIIEMLATGMPVVATRHCDIPEVVGLAFSHLLAPEGDIAKLAECIQAVLDEPDSWSRLALAGRKRIETEYHRRPQAERLVDHYCTILQDK